jgi:hypothetical protein
MQLLKPVPTLQLNHSQQTTIDMYLGNAQLLDTPYKHNKQT